MHILYIEMWTLKEKMFLLNKLYGRPVAMQQNENRE